ncbi:hypothetical protein P153DRAFT_380789 [Dothidotthia symphoricarpi CBS 119687]|uniref:Uncharacterized protein n=1 Tax=Dothidotthia symphoricarpi CBS 119687 TaxID=1392245 RepID=A0A6A6AUV0_9PLEO|nr:uncharacterized protein P153DRAFT_380789 [Dothidotthia symphoricarpi CBS 119687]KAF2134983.1 hypothetical protein P153DRAFT_380789 [Dothidotthia symphoricarpi CBS 119687]
MKSLVVLATLTTAVVATLVPASKVKSSATASSIIIKASPTVSPSAASHNFVLVGCLKDGESCHGAYGACCNECRADETHAGEREILDRYTFTCFKPRVPAQRPCLANRAVCNGRNGDCCGGACYKNLDTGDHVCRKIEKAVKHTATDSSAIATTSNHTVASSDDKKDERRCIADGADCSGEWNSCCSGACYMDRSRGSHTCYKPSNGCVESGTCVQMAATSSGVETRKVLSTNITGNLTSAIEAADKHNASCVSVNDDTSSTSTASAKPRATVDAPDVFAARQCFPKGAKCSSWKNRCCSGNCWRDWSRGGRHTCA